MFSKECPYCKQTFETPYVSDKWCTGLCKDNSKRDQKLAKWANGKRGKPNPRNAFRLYGLSGDG